MKSCCKRFIAISPPSPQLAQPKPAHSGSPARCGSMNDRLRYDEESRINGQSAAPLASEDERARRMARLDKLTAAFGNPFEVASFPKTHAASALKTQFAHLAAGEKTDQTVAVAGRIMAIRNDGMFIDLLDDTDRLQIFHDLKDLPPRRDELLGLLDLGDIIGVPARCGARRAAKSRSMPKS